MSGLKLQSPFHAGAIEKVHTASQPLWDAMHPIVTNLPRALNLRRRRADVDEGDSGPRFRSPVSARTQRDRTMQSLSPKNEEQTADAEQSRPVRPAGLFYILRSGGTAGITVRRFLAMALLVPFLVCMTSFVADAYGLFAPIHAMTFTAPLISVFILMATWRVGVLLNRID